MTRGLPSTSPRTNCGKVFWLTSAGEHVDERHGRVLVGVRQRRRRPARSRPDPPPSAARSPSARAGLAGSVADRISVTSRSARKFVKKLIQPFRREQLPARVTVAACQRERAELGSAVCPVAAPLSQPTVSMKRQPRTAAIMPQPSARACGRGLLRHALTSHYNRTPMIDMPLHMIPKTQSTPCAPPWKRTSTPTSARPWAPRRRSREVRAHGEGVTARIALGLSGRAATRRS